MQTHPRNFLTTALIVLGFGSSLWGQAMPQNFISVTPCRIADTRTDHGGAGPIPGGTYRNFTIAGACNIPSSATAFSLNVTALPNPSGSSLLYLSVLPAPATTPSGPPASSTLNDPSGTIVANAAIVPSGVNGAVTVYVSSTSDVILDIDGYFADQTNSSTEATSLGTGALTSNTGTGNTAIGYQALVNPTGSANTATGYKSLNLNSSGGSNTAYGYQALQVNTTGSSNSAFGVDALMSTSSGGSNTGVGEDALFQNSTGSGNTALGANALSALFTGDNNTAIGAGSYFSLNQGSGNIGLGLQAGGQVMFGSNNIEIGNQGFPDDNGVIRIGVPGNQSKAVVAGIYGTTIDSGAAVLVDSNGQLGTLNSSIRFKEDVHDMADSTDALMQLRPVEFRYKRPAADGTKPVQFGLIAEEVAKVYPELVVRGTGGQIDSVKYHELPAMLLNEIQKQHRTIADQQDRIQSLKTEQESMKAVIESLRAAVFNK